MPECPFCGDDQVVYEYWEGSDGPNSFAGLMCCYAAQDWFAAHPDELTAFLLSEWLIAGAIEPHEYGFVVRYRLQLAPITLRDAKAFVTRHHRHNSAPLGWRFGAGIWNGPTLVGVVMLGRPNARMLPQETWIDVSRLCIDPHLPEPLTRMACSKAYGWAAREAKRQGYHKIITYTLASEPGTSLRGAGWTPAHLTTGDSWNTPSRPREDRAPCGRKVRWEKILTDPRAPITDGLFGDYR